MTRVIASPASPSGKTAEPLNSSGSDYRIASATSPDQLTEEVKKLLKLGFNPVGSSSTFSGFSSGTGADFIALLAM